MPHELYIYGIRCELYFAQKYPETNIVQFWGQIDSIAKYYAGLMLGEGKEIVIIDNLGIDLRLTVTNDAENTIVSGGSMTTCNKPSPVRILFFLGKWRN